MSYFVFIPVIFGVMFLIVIFVFIFVFSSIIKQSNANKKAPTLTVDAKVVAKRNHVSGGSSDGISTSSSYYVTFEVTSGDRIELHIPYNQYGYIIEGDNGKLTFKGTKFIGFERSI